MKPEYWTAAGLQERAPHPVSRESVAPVLLVDDERVCQCGPRPFEIGEIKANCCIECGKAVLLAGWAR